MKDLGVTEPSIIGLLAAMQHRPEPHVCPVCSGTGTVPPGFYNDPAYGTTTDASRQRCRSCGGGGIVWQ